MTLCGFSLAYGQYLLIFPTKYVYLFAIFIFELGESPPFPPPQRCNGSQTLTSNPFSSLFLVW